MGFVGATLEGEVMSPYKDKELAAIVGPRPGPDYIWCEDCCRWENGFQQNQIPVYTSRLAGLWLRIAVVSNAVAVYFLRRRTLTQAKYLVDRGEGVSRGIGEENQKAL